MTTLVVNPIENSMVATMEYEGYERLKLAAVIPYLYFHNKSNDNITFTMAKDGVEVFSDTFTAADVKTALGTTDNYFHVYYPITPSNPIQLTAGTYTFTIDAPNYSPDGFVGWIQQHEDVQTPFSYESSDSSQNPLTIRFKEYREGIE